LQRQLHDARLGLFDEETGELAWIDREGDPPVEMGYREQSNAARTRWETLGLDVTVDTMVHPELDMLVRRVGLANPGTADRSLRVFHYQTFDIADRLYQDTAYWDEQRSAITHYNRGFFFHLVGSPSFDGYTCGEHTLRGLEGSYVDAEDGELEANPITHGAADSTVQWNLDVPADGEAEAHLFVLAGRSREQVHDLHDRIAGRDPELFTDETIGYWNNWVDNRRIQPTTRLSTDAREIYRRSLFVLHDCQAEDGAIIASPDSRTLKWGGDTYCYCWWRDGALISRALGEVGLHRDAIAFLRFAAKCQEDEGYFQHRHYPDGSVGSTWHPPPFLQIDQTASVIDAVNHYYRCSAQLDELPPCWELVRRAADFLMEFVDEDGFPRPSWDLWEEKQSINTYSVAAAIRGLRSAADLGQALAKRTGYWEQAAERMHEVALDRLWNSERGAFYKSLEPQDDTVDASSLLALLSGLLDPEDERYEQVVATVEDVLWVEPTGGVARYEDDDYYGHENAWIICTLWLARCHLELGNHERCRELIEWCTSQASPTHLLPEQVDRRTGEHTSVTPLVWSHSTFIETVNAYTRDREGVEQLAAPPVQRAFAEETQVR
jgi:oligosaccharide amylase